jgi:hypothetical protein
LGGDAKLTEGQRTDVKKAAELTALAEAMRALALQEGPGGAGAISAMVRLESACDRAIRRLGLPPPGAAAAPTPTIAEYWASRQRHEEEQE